ncbi:MAG: hypothetical protein VKJ04_04505 [Vampirovibrionales bacterium]|nr:hypothetical protein [Vampirovibrionales bacterium]
MQAPLEIPLETKIETKMEIKTDAQLDVQQSDVQQTCALEALESETMTTSSGVKKNLAIHPVLSPFVSAFAKRFETLQYQFEKTSAQHWQ